MHTKMILFMLLLGTAALLAKTLSYATLHQMPTSIEKDYYIWRFLSQPTTTPTEARRIIKEASHLNKKLKTAYKQKTGTLPPPIKSKYTTAPNHIWKQRSRAHKDFKSALKLLREGKTKEAVSYLNAARKNYKRRYDIDKTLFWLYLVTKKRVYLDQLHRSHDPNIYTLMAADALRSSYPPTLTYRFRKKKSDINIKDPITWANIKKKLNRTDDLEALARKYEAQESIGIHTYIKAKACKYTKAFFPMPYRDIMSKLPKNRQALIYAIARQESHFVPASVSRSFALGMMQFMPFLIDHVAKEKGEKIDYDEIFDPKKAIEYANYHLDYLSKYLYHPLFIAYAYNAGIGFTKRYLKNPKHFRNGPYEPYMSIESMKNAQAREYGKKVLANYVIYMNKLGLHTRIFPLMKILTTPEKTDAFRN